jgi:hypothetical protein
VRDVAAPLYRFFLADAQAAARAGETGHALECLGLALDFVPESQRERVLLAAAELAPPISSGVGAAGAGPARGSGLSPALVVEIAPIRPGVRAAGRIAWEDRPALPAPSAEYPPPADLVPPARAALARSSARPLRRLVFLVGVLAALAAAALRLGWAPAGAAEAALGGGPAERAARALAAGDAGGALRLLGPLGGEAPARVWLLRGAAYEALADTPAAVAALATAAARDADGGRSALEAGDRLGRLGAVAQAADAYLYAVTPARTEGELERIARMQERAGFLDRARRVRRQ